MDNTILEIKNLCKEYDTEKAVDDISFSINPGQIVGLLGPNGAGKTTTINMVLGVLEPTSGTIEILGKNIKDSRSEVSERMNFAAVYAQMPGNLSVRENLYVFGMMYGVKKLKEKIESLIKQYDLEKFRDMKSGLLSSGEMSRLNLAKSIINEPCLLLLDEPTASLDPSTSDLIRKRIKEYVAETDAGILWTSHNMHEIEEVCDQVLFLSHGKIILSGDPKTLPREHGKKNLEELFITIAREPLTLNYEI